MCGIAGIFSFNEHGKIFHARIRNAIDTLALRGPDSEGIYHHNNVSLGHKRLSIIDVSDAASQPFTDSTGRYVVVFNGEFFNYKEHRAALQQKGYTFSSDSDTEVLLNLYIDEGQDFVSKINGFFAFAIYDNIKETLFVCRDRFGIKPLYLYHDENVVLFASEMKALISMGIPRVIDNVSLFCYLQLNYIPSNCSIFQNVTKMEQGSWLLMTSKSMNKQKYYTIPINREVSFSGNYIQAQKQLQDLLHSAVQLRMISDVPLGTFLSGGIDSSVITAIAAQYTSNLSTFSIGFKDEPMFDETHYANLVAQKLKTNHTVFSLTNDDLLENLFNVLDYIDEPFADSSAIAVYILSKHTRKHVTVALSGDGADEMFAGYNKQQAEYMVIKNSMLLKMLSIFKPMLSLLPQSRHTPLANKFRQINRLISGATLNAKDRYWRWASLSDENQVQKLLLNDINLLSYNVRKNNELKFINNHAPDLFDVLYTDMNLVLANDMLTKVDLMSMANSLEVRVPFLDYRIVDFAFQLPVSYKIDNTGRKKILRDAFRGILPQELYTRKKHGFEVPLIKWFRKELKDNIFKNWLDDDFIKEQNIFAIDEINTLKQKIFSTNPQDVHAKIWGLIVFQYWYKKYFN
ncbi:MAG: asparagine synthase (glutamine-hydrolyzing) [Bacteroidales bacterium]|nr:asparagine synthase (glutamine-hydrolyzing) [Bacteroidales bacterium]